MGRILHLPGGRTRKGLTAATMAAVLLGSFAMTADGAAATTHLATPPAESLSSVSCVSPADCWAVGDGPATGLVLHWNGAKWSAVPSPNPAGAAGTSYNGVTCTSAASCFAVGSYVTRSADVTLPLAERWNGTKWSVVRVQAPAHYKYSYLWSITCTSTTNCWATGAAGKPFTSHLYRTLIEHWNGSAWSLVPSSPAAAASPAVLYGVTCGASNQCWAVGSWYSIYSGNESLTERWNGSAWSVVTTPRLKDTGLFADYCTGTSACLAVGETGAGDGPPSFPAFALRWTGTKWVTAPPAQPSSTYLVSLDAVACTSASACESTGIWWPTHRKSTTLAEGWNGKKWTRQATPSLPGTDYADLTGVSCPKSTDCWAVGDSLNRVGLLRPVLEHWNGKSWSLDTP